MRKNLSEESLRRIEADRDSDPVRFDKSLLRQDLAPVKLICSRMKVPPVELDGSRPNPGTRDEAARLNHKWGMDGTVGSQSKCEKKGQAV